METNYNVSNNVFKIFKDNFFKSNKKNINKRYINYLFHVKCNTKETKYCKSISIFFLFKNKNSLSL
jgi:hypothetical protein